MDSEFLKQNNLVELKDNCFIIDMMYATAENIVMHPVYKEVGFDNQAYVHIDLASLLYRVADRLRPLNLRLRIRDAYRPPVAHRRILQLLPIEGLFASKPENSLHCYGTAIDCCLTDARGRNLKFPTEIDAYQKKYARQLAFGKADEFFKHFTKARSDWYHKNYAVEINNRELLKKIMTECGFETISSEWWHFQLPQGKELYPFIEWKEK